jgi:hypothetical protein|nr:MAG TPA: hypothetical protein [Caudoviricetes sp.]
MERIYDQAKDQNVAAIVIYGKAEADGKAYADEACTVQYKTSELKDAFIKRAIIKIGTGYFIPISYSETSGKVGSVNYTTTTGSDSTLKTVLTALAAVAD